MLCKYSILYKNRCEVGEYQCDVDDFKKMFRLERSRISSAIVKLQNGEIWIYNDATRRYPRRNTKQGWEIVYRPIVDL